MKIFRNLFLSKVKASTVFFIAGILVSMLVMSVGISNSIATQQLNNTRYKLNAKQVQLVIQPNGRLTCKFWEKLYSVLSKDSGVYVDGINIPVTIMESGVPRVYPEVFKGESGLFPLLKGKYFTYENIKNKDKIALVGKGIELLLSEANGKKYVTIAGVRYEVLGIIGYKNRSSVWDRSIYFPVTSLPEKEQDIFSGSQIKVIAYSKSDDLKDDIQNMQKLFSVNGIRVLNTSEIVTNKMSFWQAISPRNFDNFVIYIFFIVSMINSLNISLSWISQRNFEIGLRKAFGHSDWNILITIFKEMLLIFSAGAALATITHLFVFKVLGSFLSLPLFTLL